MLIKDHHCLETIVESIDRILEYTSVFNSADDFNNDYRNFDATMMNFVVIGEMVDKISDEFKRNHSKIEWVKIKGFRNIVAHDYFGIDAEEVCILSSHSKVYASKFISTYQILLHPSR